MPDSRTGRAPASVYAGIAICSVGVLMTEVLLTRIFSFTIWYHLAYLTLSTALLGFGAAGSLLTAFPRLLEGEPRRLMALCAAGAGITLLAGMLLLAPHPLDPDRLLAEPLGFSLGLLGYYAVVAIPFLLAGAAIAAPLAAHATEVSRLYAADLVGASLGCLLAVAALHWLDGPAALWLCGVILVVAGAFYAPSTRLTWVLAALAGVLVLTAPGAHRVLRFQPSPSKQLASGLRQPGATTLFTRWSPVNRVDLYRVPRDRGGMWGSFGLSPHFEGSKPRVLDIQYDGHNGSNVFEVKGPDSLRMLDQHLLRTPYLLSHAPRVLVIGVGGGIDILNAIRRGASRVTGVDVQQITVDLHQGMLSGWTGGRFQRPEVELVAAEGRHYVRSQGRLYDLIQITAVDTFTAQSTGAYLLAESYLYTVEAFDDYLDHLEEDGVFSIVLGDWLYRDPSLPSPLATRLALVAREALERRGVENPRDHILLVAQRFETGAPGPVTGNVIGDLLVKKKPFRPDEIATLRGFAETHGFELRLAPDSEGDASISRLVNAPGDELGAALEAQPFVVHPVTDDRPFFYHVLPWASLASGERILWIFPGSTTGQIVLLLMLGQALVLGAVLIGLPLRRVPAGALSRRRTLHFLLYFLGLGLGFMLVEISFIQNYVLLLGSPTYSRSVTLCSLLLFTGVGAALCPRGWRRPRHFLLGLVGVTVALVVIEVLALPQVREALLEASLGARLTATFLLQLPLGICLGMYFPTGVELLRRSEPRLVPWAWAVNGFASVASSVLAVILALAVGFAGVALVAAGVYAVGTLALVSALPSDEPAGSPAEGLRAMTR
ncbi:MAG: hypothetical protein ABFS46_08940 [Myxococcota bacterium]